MLATLDKVPLAMTNELIGLLAEPMACPVRSSAPPARLTVLVPAPSAMPAVCALGAPSRRSGAGFVREREMGSQAGVASGDGRGRIYDSAPELHRATGALPCGDRDCICVNRIQLTKIQLRSPARIPGALGD